LKVNIVQLSPNFKSCCRTNNILSFPSKAILAACDILNVNLGLREVIVSDSQVSVHLCPSQSVSSSHAFNLGAAGPED